MFYGDEMQHKTRWTVLKKGYHDNGEVKRVTGLWYEWRYRRYGTKQRRRRSMKVDFIQGGSDAPEEKR